MHREELAGHNQELAKHHLGEGYIEAFVVSFVVQEVPMADDLPIIRMHILADTMLLINDAV